MHVSTKDRDEIHDDIYETIRLAVRKIRISIYVEIRSCIAVREHLVSLEAISPPYRIMTENIIG